MMSMIYKGLFRTKNTRVLIGGVVYAADSDTTITYTIKSVNLHTNYLS